MSTASVPSTTPPVWSWSPTPSDALRRKVRLTAVGALAAIAAAVAVAVLSSARFTIVIALMVLSIGVFWWLEHQRFRATVVSLDHRGTLRVADGRSDQSIELGSVDTIRLRQRTESGQSVLFTTPRWTIELAGPDGVLSHRFAQAAGFINADEADVEQLEAELRAHARRLGAPLDRPHDTPGGSAAPSLLAPPGGTTAESAAPVDGHFEWRPPTSPNAARRRRIFRIGYVGAALLIAVLGAAAAWGDWVGVVLSAVTVPGLVIVFCGGIDWALGRARRFRIVVEDGVLRIEPGDRRIALRGATVSIDTQSQMTSTNSGMQRSVHWVLRVQAADGTSLQRMFPGWGTTTREADYVALERELRRRT